MVTVHSRTHIDTEYTLNRDETNERGRWRKQGDSEKEDEKNPANERPSRGNGIVDGHRLMSMPVKGFIRSVCGCLFVCLCIRPRV